MDHQGKMTADEFVKIGRQALKPDWSIWVHAETDQGKGLEPPNPYIIPDDAIEIIGLPDFEKSGLGNFSLLECVKTRRSVRKYKNEPVTMEELSCLLWITHGVSQELPAKQEGQPPRILRTVPSGGNRHCIDTYFYAENVAGLKTGIYKYLPLEHQIALMDESEDIREKLYGGTTLFNAPLAFIWVAVPYRMEYRYTCVAAKLIALEGGHICQNLSLAAVSIGYDTCAISGFRQEKLDAALKLDGEEAFVLYLASVGKSDE